MRTSAPALVSLLFALAPALANAAEPGAPRTRTATRAHINTENEYDQGVEDGEITDVREEEPQVRRPRREVPKYRNPQGSITLSGVLGASTGTGGTRFFFGLGVGYAVIDGVVPGVRGEFITGDDGMGGEVASTLTLSLPVSWSITPFVLGEVGRRFEPFGSGWLYGAGGGVFLGDPGSALAVQLGWMFRGIDFGGTIGKFDLSGPLVAISVRL